MRQLGDVCRLGDERGVKRGWSWVRVARASGRAAKGMSELLGWKAAGCCRLAHSGPRGRSRSSVTCRCRSTGLVAAIGAAAAFTISSTSCWLGCAGMGATPGAAMSVSLGRRGARGRRRGVGATPPARAFARSRSCCSCVRAGHSALCRSGLTCATGINRQARVQCVWHKTGVPRRRVRCRGARKAGARYFALAHRSPPARAGAPSHHDHRDRQNGDAAAGRVHSSAPLLLVCVHRERGSSVTTAHPRVVTCRPPSRALPRPRPPLARHGF